VAVSGGPLLWVPKTSSVGCDLHLLDPPRTAGQGTRGSSAVLLRLSYLALTGMVTLLRLLPMSNTDKDIESTDVDAGRDQLGGAVVTQRV
jgi:hypothetical protein